MEIIMDLANDIVTTQESQLSVFRHEECPFRLSDMALPTCNTGFFICWLAHVILLIHISE